MKSESVPAAADSAQGQGGMTGEEIAAFFARRQALYNDLDAAALAADYADAAVIESPIAGIHTGPADAEHALRAIFQAFQGLSTSVYHRAASGST